MPFPPVLAVGRPASRGPGGSGGDGTAGTPLRAACRVSGGRSARWRAATRRGRFPCITGRPPGRRWPRNSGGDGTAGPPLQPDCRAPGPFGAGGRRRRGRVRWRGGALRAPDAPGGTARRPYRLSRDQRRVGGAQPGRGRRSRRSGRTAHTGAAEGSTTPADTTYAWNAKRKGPPRRQATRPVRTPAPPPASSPAQSAGPSVAARLSCTERPRRPASRPERGTRRPVAAAVPGPRGAWRPTGRAGEPPSFVVAALSPVPRRPGTRQAARSGVPAVPSPPPR